MPLLKRGAAGSERSAMGFANLGPLLDRKSVYLGLGFTVWFGLS